MAVIRSREIREKASAWLAARGQSTRTFRETVNADAKAQIRKRIRRQPSIEDIARDIERRSRGDY